ncbi:unnamed protein product, partial [Ectocarpus fasciculatus]
MSQSCKTKDPRHPCNSGPALLHPAREAFEYRHTKGHTHAEKAGGTHPGIIHRAREMVALYRLRAAVSSSSAVGGRQGGAPRGRRTRPSGLLLGLSSLRLDRLRHLAPPAMGDGCPTTGGFRTQALFFLRGGLSAELLRDRGGGETRYD